jgi:hypothetical protein
MNKYEELAKRLNLPYVIMSGFPEERIYISMKDLYEMLSDDKQVRELISRLKLKAFW